IGFVGGISSRIDFPLVEALVKNNPQWNFAFWGPIQTSEARRRMDRLRRRPNFTHGETQHKDAVPAIISHFDVATIPYDSSQSFNRYCYPMKLFEYFYMGKPILSTPIEELSR